MSLVAEFIDAAAVSHDVIALGYFDLLAAEFEPGDSTAYGTARLMLRAQGGGSFTPVDHMEVKVWEKDGAGNCTYRWFGGHVVDVQDGEDGGEKVIQVTCRDYSEELDCLILETSRGTPSSATSFQGCITDMVQKIQNTGGTANSGIDATSDVAALTPGETYAHFSWPQFTALRKILDDICAWAQLRVPTLRPRYTVGLSTTGTIFGPPSVHVWDAAATPTPVFRFSTRQSDINAGTHKPILGPYTRKLDGTQLATRVAALGANGLYSIASNSTAVGLYPNRYSATNSWSRSPVSDTSLTTQTDVDGLQARTLAASAFSRESVTYATWERVQPGQYVSLTNDFNGLADVVYPIASTRVVFISPLKTKTYFTLGARRLELGDDDNGALAQPVENDKLPPDPPTVLTLAANTYNAMTGLTDLTFSWTGSTAGDVQLYELRLFYPDSGGGRPYRLRTDGTSIVASMPPNVSFNARVQAVDYHNNWSINSNTVADTSAPPVTPSLYNASFELVDPGDSTKAAGWITSGTANYNGRANGNIDADGSILGDYCYLFRGRPGQAAMVTSTRMIVESGAQYEANIATHLFSGPGGFWLTFKILFYDGDDNYLSGQDAECLTNELAYAIGWPLKTIVFDVPGGAVSCAMVIQLDSGNNGEYVSIDGCTIQKLGGLSGVGALSSDNATRATQIQMQLWAQILFPGSLGGADTITTTFNTDGSSTTTYAVAGLTIDTTYNADGSITRVFTGPIAATITTTFSDNQIIRGVS